MTPRERERVRDNLLAVIDDLRKSAVEGEIQVLAYAACDAEGNRVVTGLTNAGIKPITLLGALTVLAHRLVGAMENAPGMWRTGGPDGLTNNEDPDEPMH